MIECGDRVDVLGIETPFVSATSPRRTTRGPHAWKVVVPPERGGPELRSHDGCEWLCVLAGELHLILADHDITLQPGVPTPTRRPSRVDLE